MMRSRVLINGMMCLGLLAAIGLTGSAETAYESARNLPLAYDVDVVVAGGSAAGVAAAVEAAKQGASVFLAAPRTYLGDDLCATYRLWLEPGEAPESALAKAIYAPAALTEPIGSTLPFSYSADALSSKNHPDTTPPSLLSDGKSSKASTESVQYDGDAVITLDLGKVSVVSRIHVLAFQRKGDFELKQALVAVSEDAQTWTDAGAIGNGRLSQGNFEDAPLHLAGLVNKPARYVRMVFQKSEKASRILLGELIVEAPSEPAKPKAASAPAPPTPMQVKRVLDDALVEAGIPFLYGCFPAGLLRDAAGQPAGLVIANRAGRQAVRAKVIIDATARATVARMAGAQVTPYPAGKHAFERVIIGGQAPETPGLRMTEMPSPIAIMPDVWGPDAYRTALRYTLDIDMPDASFAAFAEAEQTARDLTWNPELLMASESLFENPPDSIRGKKSMEGAWTSADKAPLDAFRPESVERVYVLSACADVSRAAAPALARPLALMNMGERIGRAAADDAKNLTKGDAVRAAALQPPPAETTGSDVHENLTGLRPTQRELPSIPSEACGIPVLGDYDVVVVGGGTGGAPAGISAARKGAKTLVIEFQDGLGGVSTLGLIGKYYFGYREGFTAEVDKGTASMDGQTRPISDGWNVEWRMEWFRRALRDAGADIWFGALGCGALVENGRVTGVVVATPMSRGVVRAKVVIDATGNADVAAAAGAACMVTGADHVAVQGTGMPPRQPGASYTNTDYTITDETDVVDAWRTLLAGRSKYQDSFDLGGVIDSRERRRIVGEFVISPLDIWNERTYPDTIGWSRSNFDTHGFTVHALFALQPPHKDAVFAATPYRALLPKGLEGILVIGLGISAHRDAMPILRMEPDIQNQGYAAGLAAAMAVQANSGVRDIDIKALQQQLVEKNCVPASVLTDRDSYPISREQLEQAMAKVAGDYEGVALLLAAPAESMPMLCAAYDQVQDPAAKTIYAHILGMMGNDHGASALADAVAASSWDTGWSFTGSGQFGMSLSHVDSLMIALARTHDTKALPLILEKAKTLDSTSAFSHHRAVAIALETLALPEAASTLAEILRKPGMTGYACLTVENAKANAALPSPNLEREQSIRELVLARALLRCGDFEGIAEGILRQYERDLRGHWARHAQAVLNERAMALPDAAAYPLDIESAAAATRGKIKE